MTIMSVATRFNKMVMLRDYAANEEANRIEGRNGREPFSRLKHIWKLENQKAPILLSTSRSNSSLVQSSLLRVVGQTKMDVSSLIRRKRCRTGKTTPTLIRQDPRARRCRIIDQIQIQIYCFRRLPFFTTFETTIESRTANGMGC